MDRKGKHLADNDQKCQFFGKFCRFGEILNIKINNNINIENIDRRVNSFFGPISSGFGPKKRFYYRTPDFVNGLFVACGKMVDFTTLDWFFDFLFPNNGFFVKKKRPKRQKVFPHPTVAVLSASNSPIAFSAQALWLDNNDTNDNNNDGGQNIVCSSLSFKTCNQHIEHCKSIKGMLLERWK